ncbi:NgoMIV family type II restriction endonuclease [Mangrovihabitans endophyticus]|uniref:NgoMIV restriction enzyme n=1 Tax=Mangrovihabitans endophyticus TaxID=1751298 RepID=A0A8J3C1A0_9ACTN|nr:NgoMIV family type II restriction endonuclease [Mangrovihabitans endophyticus]GGK94350.1 hypothetical protein GCM10012284_30490 [Mangrovihabitans endophyticus]
MPAPFVKRLCGYRTGGNPNTSDNSDALSKELGHALFEAIGVPPNQVGPSDVGTEMEAGIRRHLHSLRPDLRIQDSPSAAEFEQYRHLTVFPRFRRDRSDTAAHLAPVAAAVAAMSPSNNRENLQRLLEEASQRLRAQDDLSLELLLQMPEEALLNIDVTVADLRPGSPSRLHIALSSKWSLRTDRAQDCVSQGAKLVAQRRGRMPHFAVVTMEPRPSMLKILGDGSGSVDCIYHLDLPALEQAMETLVDLPRRRGRKWAPMQTFRRLIAQRRLLDYDELLEELAGLPPGEAAR